MTSTIRAARVHEHGDPRDVVQVLEIPAPVLTPGSVRVAVEAAAVNYPDILMITGGYQVAMGLPYTPGCEFAGRIVEVADDVLGLEIGDNVCGLNTHGAFAEEVVIDAHRVTVLGDVADWRAAAALSVTYTTAYHALRTFADVQPGEWVVVLGAAGGVGLATVDIAKALGANVLAAAGDDAKLSVCKDKGADAVINYATEDLKLGIREVTTKGADVVIDPVGGPYSEAALRAISWGGRFIVVGFAAGIPSIPLNLVLLKGARVMGFENRTIMDQYPVTAPEHRSEMFQMFAEGRVQPHVSQTFPLEQVAEAIDLVAGRQSIGKVAIDVGTASPANHDS